MVQISDIWQWNTKIYATCSIIVSDTRRNYFSFQNATRTGQL